VFRGGLGYATVAREKENFERTRKVKGGIKKEGMQIFESTEKKKP